MALTQRFRMQGLTHLHICLHPSAEVAETLLQPLAGLRRLQALSLENRGQAQPNLAGLAPLGAALHQLRVLRVQGCVVGAASGLGACTSLRTLQLSNCILMMVWGRPPCSRPAAWAAPLPALSLSQLFCNKKALLGALFQGP